MDSNKISAKRNLNEILIDVVLPEGVDDVLFDVVDDVVLPEVVDDSNDEKEGCKAGGSDCTSDPIVLDRKNLTIVIFKR